MSTPASALRPIPANPSLEFDKRQARTLLQSIRATQPDAIERLRRYHPRFNALPTPLPPIALHDAQLVIAREYGFASWPRWKQFVELRRLDRAQQADELIKAACSNDVRKARVLLLADPSLAAFDLAAACACGELDAVRQCIHLDPAKVNQPCGPLNLEPLLYACFSRLLRADRVRSGGIVQVAKLLLEHGADPNAFYWMESPGEKWMQTALYAASGIANSEALTTALIDAGARLDTRDKESLYHATEFPDATCLQLLLERATPPADQVTYCLARATDFDYPRHIALFLQAGADPNARINWDGQRTHLHKAVYQARSETIIRQLIDAHADVNARDIHGVSILRSAVRNGDQAVVALLQSRGAVDPDITAADAATGCPMTLCIAAYRNDTATIDRLLNNGVDLNGLGSPSHMPPLHAAAWHGQLNAVRKLIERGADIHERNTYGGDALGTTIHGSANCFDAEGGPAMRLPDEALPGDYPQIVEYLIQQGAKLPASINGGSDSVQEVLRRHGVADPD